MKRFPHFFLIRLLPVTAAATLAWGTPLKAGTSATYAGPTGGTTTWNAGSNWNTNPTVPGAAGNTNDTVLYSLTASGETFTLDTAITLKSITNNTGNRGVILTNGTGGSLTFATTDATTPTVSLTSTVDTTVLISFGNATGALTTDLSQGLTFNVTGMKAATSQIRIVNASTTFTGSGTVTLNSGILAPQGANLVPANNRIALNGAQFEMSGSARNQIVRGLEGNAGSSVSNFSNATMATITLGNGNTLATDSYTFAGVIGADSKVATPVTGNNIAVIKAGLGTEIFSGANTYTGGTSITGGTLQLATGGTLGATTGSLGINGGTLDLNGVNTTVGALTLGGSTGTTIATTGSATLTTTGITISGTHNTIGTGASVTNQSGATAISGGAALTVNGALSGTTTVSGASSLLNGNGSTGALTVGTGGTVAGTLSTGALAVQSGGIVSPGSGPGVLTASSGTLFSGGSYTLQMNTQGTGAAGTNWDQLTLTGNLNLASLTSGTTFTLNLQTLNGSNAPGALATFNSGVNHTWASVITSGGFTLPGGGFNPNLFTITTTGFQNSLNGTFSLVQDSGNSNNLDLVYTTAVVPEPGTWAMMVGGLVLLVAVQRRRMNVSCRR